MDKPLEYEFAKDGDRNTNLPNANADDNSVSFQSGFTLPYELNPANGGKNIERSDMNEIFYRICKAINDTAEQVGAWVKLTTENLNEVKQKGYYYQNANIQATNERNYPTNTAGYLIVFNNSISSWGVTQFYKVYNSDRVYIRRTISATEWSAWDSFVLTSEYNAKVTQLQNSINTKEDKTKITLQPMPNQNWNNVKTQGLYYMNANGTNKPVSNALFGIGLNYSDDGSFYQEAHDFETGRIYSRHWNTSSWSAWDRTAMISEVYTKSNTYTKSEVNTKTFDNSTLASFSVVLGTTYTNQLNRTANYYFSGSVKPNTSGSCNIAIDGVNIFSYSWVSGTFSRPLNLSFLVKPNGKFIITGSNFTYKVTRQA